MAKVKKKVTKKKVTKKKVTKKKVTKRSNNSSEIVLILDKSGSMGGVVEDAIGGINTFLKAQKKVPGKATATVVLFNHEYEVVHEGIDLKEVPLFDEKSYVPSGMTALLDAIGRTIDSVAKRISKLSKAKQPKNVIFAILTDGHENSSTDYNLEKIKDSITKFRKDKKWEFIFLAANQDAFAAGRSYGIAAASTFSYDSSKIGTRSAYATLDCAVTKARGVISDSDVKTKTSTSSNKK